MKKNILAALIALMILLMVNAGASAITLAEAQKLVGKNKETTFTGESMTIAQAKKIVEYNAPKPNPPKKPTYRPVRTVYVPVPERTQIHEVQRRETLSGIAKESGATISVLMALNPKIENPGHIEAGWVLKVPANVTREVSRPPKADSRLVEKLDETRKQLERAEAQIAELTRENEALQKREARALAENNKMRRKMADLKNTNQNLRDKNQELIAEKPNLRSKKTLTFADILTERNIFVGTLILLTILCLLAIWSHKNRKKLDEPENFPGFEIKEFREVEVVNYTITLPVVKKENEDWFLIYPFFTPGKDEHIIVNNLKRACDAIKWHINRNSIEFEQALKSGMASPKNAKVA